jgi:uroporphyrinogen-III synthase
LTKALATFSAMSDDLPPKNRQDELVEVVYTGTRSPTFDDPRLRIHHMPMLEAVPVDFDQKRVEILVRQPCTLIFYSQNSVSSVAESGVLDEIDLSEHTIWAVGEKTADEVHERFGTVASVPDDERFDGLVDTFLQNPPPRPIVAFSLKGSPRDLARRLREPGNVHEVPVYHTCPVLYPSLSADLARIGADWVAFTSPRGVGTFYSQAEGVNVSQFQFAAIGPTTAAAIKERGLRPSLVLNTPDKNLMMRRIVDAEGQ